MPLLLSLWSLRSCGLNRCAGGQTAGREVPPVFQRVAPGDLKDLDIKNDLGLLEVVRRDHLFHEFQLFRGIANGERSSAPHSHTPF